MPLFALGHHREEGSGQVIVGGDLEEVDPGSDAGGGNSLFSLRRGFGESLSELGICGVDGHLFAGLGVLYDDEAGVWEFDFLRVDDAYGDDLVACRQTSKRNIPARVAEEVGDDKDKAPATHDTGTRVEKAGEWQLVRCRVRRRQEMTCESQDLGAATLGFNELLDGVVPQHCADAVSPMAEKTGEGRDEFVGDLFLGATAMAELHRQCAVEKEPGCEISVFVVLANKWSVHPRGDVPVDAADIIIGLIFAKIRYI